MARPKKVSDIIDVVKDNITKIENDPPTLIQGECEYNGYVIVTEPHDRVIVTDRGLHVVEYVDTDSDIEQGIAKAKEYIDGCN